MTNAARQKLPLLALILAGLAVNLWIAFNNASGFGVDFNQFYAAGQLVGTGHLYDFDALRRLEAEHGQPVMTGRLPVVALGFKLFTLLPYDAAHWAWVVLCAAALIAFAALWPGADRWWMLAALAWSMPAALLVVLGQDTPLWLAFFTAALLLLARRRPIAAGVVFALCICKFHLAVAIPVFLIAQRRWKTAAAAAASVAVFLAACFVEGNDWPRRYLGMVTQPLFSPAHERMPNIRGIAAWLPAERIFEIAGAAILLTLLWIVCRRSPTLGIAGAATAACGLLLGRHAYANDCTLLIPLAVFALQLDSTPAALKLWAIFLLTPLLTVLLASPRPLIGQLAVVGFVIACLAWWAAVSPPLSKSAPPSPR